MAAREKKSAGNRQLGNRRDPDSSRSSPTLASLRKYSTLADAKKELLKLSEEFATQKRGAGAHTRQRKNSVASVAASEPGIITPVGRSSSVGSPKTTPRLVAKKSAVGRPPGSLDVRNGITSPYGTRSHFRLLRNGKRRSTKGFIEGSLRPIEYVVKKKRRVTVSSLTSVSVPTSANTTPTQTPIPTPPGTPVARTLPLSDLTVKQEPKEEDSKQVLRQESVQRQADRESQKQDTEQEKQNKGHNQLLEHQKHTQPQSDNLKERQQEEKQGPQQLDHPQESQEKPKQEHQQAAQKPEQKQDNLEGKQPEKRQLQQDRQRQKQQQKQKQHQEHTELGELSNQQSLITFDSPSQFIQHNGKKTGPGGAEEDAQADPVLGKAISSKITALIKRSKATAILQKFTEMRAERRAAEAAALQAAGGKPVDTNSNLCATVKDELETSFSRLSASAPTTPIKVTVESKPSLNSLKKKSESQISEASPKISSNIVVNDGKQCTTLVNAVSDMVTQPSKEINSAVTTAKGGDLVPATVSSKELLTKPNAVCTAKPSTSVTRLGVADMTPPKTATVVKSNAPVKLDAGCIFSTNASGLAQKEPLRQPDVACITPPGASASPKKETFAKPSVESALLKKSSSPLKKELSTQSIGNATKLVTVSPIKEKDISVSLSKIDSPVLNELPDQLVAASMATPGTSPLKKGETSKSEAEFPGSSEKKTTVVPKDGHLVDKSEVTKEVDLGDIEPNELEAIFPAEGRVRPGMPRPDTPRPRLSRPPTDPSRKLAVRRLENSEGLEAAKEARTVARKRKAGEPADGSRAVRRSKTALARKQIVELPSKKPSVVLGPGGVPVKRGRGRPPNSAKRDASKQVQTAVNKIGMKKEMSDSSKISAKPGKTGNVLKLDSSVPDDFIKKVKNGEVVLGNDIFEYMREKFGSLKEESVNCSVTNTEKSPHGSVPEVLQNEFDTDSGKALLDQVKEKRASTSEISKKGFVKCSSVSEKGLDQLQRVTSHGKTGLTDPQDCTKLDVTGQEKHNDITPLMDGQELAVVQVEEVSDVTKLVATKSETVTKDGCDCTSLCVNNSKHKELSEDNNSINNAVVYNKNASTKDESNKINTGAINSGLTKEIAKVTTKDSSASGEVGIETAKEDCAVPEKLCKGEKQTEKNTGENVPPSDLVVTVVEIPKVCDRQVVNIKASETKDDFKDDESTLKIGSKLNLVELTGPESLTTHHTKNDITLDIGDKLTESDKNEDIPSKTGCNSVPVLRSESPLKLSANNVKNNESSEMTDIKSSPISGKIAVKPVSPAKPQVSCSDSCIISAEAAVTAVSSLVVAKSPVVPVSPQAKKQLCMESNVGGNSSNLSFAAIKLADKKTDTEKDECDDELQKKLKVGAVFRFRDHGFGDSPVRRCSVDPSGRPRWGQKDQATIAPFRRKRSLSEGSNTECLSDVMRSFGTSSGNEKITAATCNGQSFSPSQAKLASGDVFNNLASVSETPLQSQSSKGSGLTPPLKRPTLEPVNSMTKKSGSDISEAKLSSDNAGESMEISAAKNISTIVSNESCNEKLEPSRSTEEKSINISLSSSTFDTKVIDDTPAAETTGIVKSVEKIESQLPPGLEIMEIEGSLENCKASLREKDANNLGGGLEIIEIKDMENREDKTHSVTAVREDLNEEVIQSNVNKDLKVNEQPLSAVHRRENQEPENLFVDIITLSVAGGVEGHSDSVEVRETGETTEAKASKRYKRSDTEEALDQILDRLDTMEGSGPSASSVETTDVMEISSREPTVTTLIEESEEDRAVKESVLRALGLTSRHAPPPPPPVPTSAPYTGTLRTVIKRTSPEKRRRSLKMVLKQGSAGNSRRDAGSHSDSGEEKVEYRICKESELASGYPSNLSANNRKAVKNSTHHSFYELSTNSPYVAATPGSQEDTTPVVPNSETVEPSAASVPPASGDKVELVIPEKSASFSIHPGRLCSDVCTYCCGKFGTLDTPCHIAQLKSAERQRKVLEIETHLTADSCLCDACYRHVDRKANCPSYKESRKRYHRSGSGVGGTGSVCAAQGCDQPAPHHVRRKWLLKLKRSVAKKVPVDTDKPQAHFTLCPQHYSWVEYFMVCGICNRRLARAHMYSLGATEARSLNAALTSDGIPARVSPERFLCKLCRYYASLRAKCRNPANLTGNQKMFFNSYRKKILKYHDIEVSGSETEDPTSQGQESSAAATVPGNHPKAKKRRHKMGSSGTSKEETVTGAKPSQEHTEMVKGEGSVATVVSEPQQVIPDTPMIDFSNLASISNSLTVTPVPASVDRQPGSRRLSVGEEEVLPPVQASFEFHGAGGAPRGGGEWELCTASLQFTADTKRLFQTLQRPYGSHSSFLRHLLLMEKYWRQGDLVLSPRATHRSATYVTSVQHRLRAFDYTPLQRPASTASAPPPALVTARRVPSAPPVSTNSVTVIPMGTSMEPETQVLELPLRSPPAVSVSSPPPIQPRPSGSGGTRKVVLEQKPRVPGGSYVLSVGRGGQLVPNSVVKVGGRTFLYTPSTAGVARRVTPPTARGTATTVAAARANTATTSSGRGGPLPTASPSGSAGPWIASVRSLAPRAFNKAGPSGVSSPNQPRMSMTVTPKTAKVNKSLPRGALPGPKPSTILTPTGIVRSRSPEVTVTVSPVPQQ